MRKYQISKYNPVFRTEDGLYLKDDWTSVSDVNRIFGGKLFTTTDYLETEIKYLNFIKRLLDETESSYLRIVGLEKYEDSLVKIKDIPYDERSDEIYNTLAEGKVLNLEDSLVLIKLILREQVWCYLTNKYLTVQIGNDYYLNITMENEPIFFSDLESLFELYVKRIE